MLTIENCATRFCRNFHSTAKILQIFPSQVDKAINSASSVADDIKFSLPDRYAGFGSSVWNEYTKFDSIHKTLNLGHGMPDFAGPEYITNALVDIAKSDNALLHQYTRGFGHLRLVQAVSKFYSQLQNREIDPLNEVLITSGAYEALFSSIQGHSKPGDEFIIIEPYFDSYEPMVVAGGGVPVFVPLRPVFKEDGLMSSADWVLDPAELESKFNSRTKAVILNTPHNPIGKVFSLEELTLIADLCKKWNALVITDEVYEWLVYKPNKHIRISTLPDMWERTITIGSAGKTFNVTGWKIGWAYGPANLIKNLMMVHQNCVYACPTPIQEAVARGFELETTRLGSPDSYFNILPKVLEAKRDFMAEFLTDVGMKPTIPQGGYFMLADWTSLENKINLNEESDKWRDFKFTKWLGKNVKLLAIPPTAFYSEKNKHIGESFIRFCFIKKDENLEKAAGLLKEWKNNNFLKL